jgi:hypothetical protein
MPRARTSTKRPRSWQFTLIPYTEEQEAHIMKVSEENGSVLFCGFGREVAPTTGTRHLQGAFYLKNGKTLSAAKKVFGIKEMHLAPAHDAGALNRYNKKDGDYWSYGSPPAQGRRTDLESIRQAIVAGESEESIADAHFGVWCLHRKAFKEYRKLKHKWKTGPREFWIYYGATGTGKSKKAFADFPGAYRLDHPNCNTVWWDSYDGEDVVIIDEFYGWIPYNMLLSLLDRQEYRLSVPTRTGPVPFVATKIVFTTNKKWTNWYPNIPSISALARRVEEFGHVVHFQALGDGGEASSSS